MRQTLYYYRSVHSFLLELLTPPSIMAAFDLHPPSTLICCEVESTPCLLLHFDNNLILLSVSISLLPHKTLRHGFTGL